MPFSKAPIRKRMQTISCSVPGSSSINPYSISSHSASLFVCSSTLSVETKTTRPLALHAPLYKALVARHLSSPIPASSTSLDHLGVDVPNQGTLHPWSIRSHTCPGRRNVLFTAFCSLFSPDWTKRLQVTSLAQQNWGEGGSSRFVPLWKDRILPGRQSPPWNPWIKKSSPLTPPPSPEMSYSRAPVKTGFLNLAHHRSFSLAAPCAPECCSSHVSVFHTYMRVHAGPSLVSVFHTSVPRLVLCRCFPQVDSTRLLFIMKLLNIYCSYPLWFAQGILYPSSPGRKWNHVPVGTSRDRSY